MVRLFGVLQLYFNGVHLNRSESSFIKILSTDFLTTHSLRSLEDTESTELIKCNPSVLSVSFIMPFGASVAGGLKSGFFRCISGVRGRSSEIREEGAVTEGDLLYGTLAVAPIHDMHSPTAGLISIFWQSVNCITY